MGYKLEKQTRQQDNQHIPFFPNVLLETNKNASNHTDEIYMGHLD